MGGSSSKKPRKVIEICFYTIILFLRLVFIEKQHYGFLKITISHRENTSEEENKDRI